MPCIPSGCEATSHPEIERLRVLSLIADSVESTAALSAFESLAGRGAMIGFVVAAIAEVFTPRQGLFTGWDGEDLTAYGAAALLLISCSAVMAAVSKRKFSAKFNTAILTSLTALAGSQGSKGIDGAVDFVFDKVFSSKMLEFNFFDMDDYI
ncbi:hypothetical protein WJX72_009924 [[Myrmecia] bisecta]|uniref:Uncharacterized protein n=1 Tax=[Myrmecia] bisecta TaxID=41462 RepID=A0AAW1QSD5_9CHLO